MDDEQEEKQTDRGSANARRGGEAADESPFSPYFRQQLFGARFDEASQVKYFNTLPARARRCRWSLRRRLLWAGPGASQPIDAPVVPDAIGADVDVSAAWPDRRASPPRPQHGQPRFQRTGPSRNGVPPAGTEGLPNRVYRGALSDGRATLESPRFLPLSAGAPFNVSAGVQNPTLSPCRADDKSVLSDSGVLRSWEPRGADSARVADTNASRATSERRQASVECGSLLPL
jgi:hypothetical protein